MLEKVIEKKLRAAVRDAGGLALKFVSPSLDGMPDRILLFPDGQIAFVETKAHGKTLRPLQEKRKKQLEAFGFRVFCVDSIEQISIVIAHLKGGDAE